MKKIYLSGDHAGFKLKNRIKMFLNKKGYDVQDFGPFKYNPRDDYPDFVIPMTKQIVKSKGRGIIIAGSGQGEAILSNKLKSIRAGLYHGGNAKIVKIGREHDNTNILCLGSRLVKEAEAKKAINIFLTTEFQRGRHLRRLNKMRKIR